jgi:hypothetical protein
MGYVISLKLISACISISPLRLISSYIIIIIIHIQSSASPKPKGLNAARSKLIPRTNLISSHDRGFNQQPINLGVRSKYYTRKHNPRETACGGWGKFRARRRLAKSRPQIRTFRPAANRHARTTTSPWSRAPSLCTTLVVGRSQKKGRKMCVAGCCTI